MRLLIIGTETFLQLQLTDLEILGDVNGNSNSNGRKTVTHNLDPAEIKIRVNKFSLNGIAENYSFFKFRLEWFTNAIDENVVNKISVKHGSTGTVQEILPDMEKSTNISSRKYGADFTLKKPSSGWFNTTEDYFEILLNADILVGNNQYCEAYIFTNDGANGYLNSLRFENTPFNEPPKIDSTSYNSSYSLAVNETVNINLLGYGFGLPITWIVQSNGSLKYTTAINSLGQLSITGDAETPISGTLVIRASLENGQNTDISMQITVTN